MDRDFRRRHWRWLALSALCLSLTGYAASPVMASEAGMPSLAADAEVSADPHASHAALTVRPAPASPASSFSSSPVSSAPDIPDTPPAALQAQAEEGQEGGSNPEFALVPSRDSDQQGMASWYGPGLHGRLTASGERFDKQEFTAAHRSFAFGSRVCVRSAATGKAVVVRINDRGPFSPGRVIDLSQAAAQELGLVGLGIKPVELWQLDDGEEECPETLVTAQKAEALRKTRTEVAQAAPAAQAQVQARARPQPRGRVQTQLRARVPAPRARTAVASRAVARPVARAAAPATASATAVASAAQSVR